MTALQPALTTMQPQTCLRCTFAAALSGNSLPNVRSHASILLSASIRLSRVGKLTLGRIPAKACFVRSRLLSCFRLLAAVSTSAISPAHEPRFECESQTNCAADKMCEACWQVFASCWVKGSPCSISCAVYRSSAIARSRTSRNQRAYLCAMTRSAAIAGQSRCHYHR